MQDLQWHLASSGTEGPKAPSACIHGSVAIIAQAAGRNTRGDGCARPLLHDLSVGLSQEQGRKAWAALDSEMTALRLIVGGSGSPAGSVAAGSFVRLAKVLGLRLLRVRGWGSALQAWRSASTAGRCGSRVQAGRGLEVRVGTGKL